LAYYLDLIDLDPLSKSYFLTPLGQEYLKNKDVFNRKIFILERIASWKPMEFYIKYILENPGCTSKDIVSELGTKMKSLTKILSKYNVIKLSNRYREGVEKPFNTAIIEGLLTPLALELNLIKTKSSKGPYFPTNLAYKLFSIAEREEELIWTKPPNERYILAALIQMLIEDNNIYIMTPWIDERIVKNLLLKFKEKVSTIILRSDELYNEKAKKVLKEQTAIEIYEYPKTQYSALHSKIIVGEQTMIISSANLTQRSLYNNLEIGVFIKNKTEIWKTRLLMKQIINSSTKLRSL